MAYDLTTFQHPKPFYVGFHRDADLPVKRGQTVVIPRGTPVLHRGKVTLSKRANTITVDHILSGMSVPAYDAARYHNVIVPRDLYGNVLVPVYNPSVRWAGVGGYWSEVDINFLTDTSACSEYSMTAYCTIARALYAVESMDRTLELLFADHFLGYGGRGTNLNRLRVALESLRTETANADIQAACSLVIEAYPTAA